jgi:putative FmdB family regulatory protein
MPIFEYRCDRCGHVMEILEKSRSSAKHTCEQCGSKDMKKLLSSFAVGRSEAPMPQCDSCPSEGACSTGTCPFS